MFRNRSALLMSVLLAGSGAVPGSAAAAPAPTETSSGPAGPVAAEPATVTFEFTGVRQPWVVPGACAPSPSARSEPRPVRGRQP